MFHYIAIWLLIIWIFITARFWLWLYKNAFWIQINKKIIAISLIIWWISAGSILLFPKIMDYINIKSFINWDYSWKWIWIFMLYLNSLILLINTIFKTFNIKAFINLVFFNIFFIFLVLIWKHLNLNIYVLNIVLYYIFVAYGEEFTKNQLALSVNEKIWKVESDIILYHILTAIWFAFWENIVYLMWAISPTTFLNTLFWGLGIVLLRWLLGFWAHTFYSSLVWMWNTIWIIFIPIFIIFAMLIHYGYDLSLYFDLKFIIPIFIIAVYAWLSYVFYKLDRIYVEA